MSEICDKAMGTVLKQRSMGYQYTPTRQTLEVNPCPRYHNWGVEATVQNQPWLMRIWWLNEVADTLGHFKFSSTRAVACPEPIKHLFIRRKPRDFERAARWSLKPPTPSTSTTPTSATSMHTCMQRPPSPKAPFGYWAYIGLLSPAHFMSCMFAVMTALSMPPSVLVVRPGWSLAAPSSSFWYSESDVKCRSGTGTRVTERTILHIRKHTLRWTRSSEWGARCMVPSLLLWRVCIVIFPHFSR